MEDVNHLMKHSSFQREGYSLITSRTTEAHQAHSRLKECRPCTYPDPYQQPHPWTTAIELTKSPQVGTHSFEDMSLLCPPLPGKAIKLFFSTSPQTLSLRFNSALLHRGRVFGITMLQAIRCLMRCTSIETNEKHWLMIGANHNPRFWVLKEASWDF